jgi:hypothetical protein
MPRTGDLRLVVGYLIICILIGAFVGHFLFGYDNIMIGYGSSRNSQYTRKVTNVLAEENRNAEPRVVELVSDNSRP